MILYLATLDVKAVNFMTVMNLYKCFDRDIVTRHVTVYSVPTISITFKQDTLAWDVTILDIVTLLT